MTFEGILVISWGVKKPIQLKIQDEKQIFPGEPPIKSPDLISPLGNKRSIVYLQYSSILYVQPYIKCCLEQGFSTFFDFTVYSRGGYIYKKKDYFDYNTSDFWQGYDTVGRVRWSSSYWWASRSNSRWIQNWQFCWRWHNETTGNICVLFFCLNITNLMTIKTLSTSHISYFYNTKPCYWSVSLTYIVPNTIITVSIDYIEYESKTLRPLRAKSINDESSNLFRTMSDASLVKMRVKSKRMAERQNNRNYRFSINGHFYNYKVCSY